MKRYDLTTKLKILAAARDSKLKADSEANHSSYNTGWLNGYGDALQSIYNIILGEEIFIDKNGVARFSGVTAEDLKDQAVVARDRANNEPNQQSYNAGWLHGYAEGYADASEQYLPGADQSCGAKKKYCVTIVRTGCLFIEADSESEAMDIADHQTTDTVNWSEDWSPTACEELDALAYESETFISEKAFE